MVAKLLKKLEIMYRKSIEIMFLIQINRKPLKNSVLVGQRKRFRGILDNV